MPYHENEIGYKRTQSEMKEETTIDATQSTPMLTITPKPKRSRAQEEDADAEDIPDVPPQQQN